MKSFIQFVNESITDDQVKHHKSLARFHELARSHAESGSDNQKRHERLRDEHNQTASNLENSHKQKIAA